jgi:NodT family efflux transporter outer membrane factor (OMF) lipoprotein
MADPQLNSLVHRAIQSNFDLQIAATRLQEARSTEVAVTGGVVPGVGSLTGADVSVGAGRGSGTNTTRGRVVAPLNAASNTTGFKEITQVMGFDTGWEIDLFGRFRRMIEASRADVQAESEARNAVLVTVIADVVRNYVSVRSFQYRLDVARQNVAAQRKTYDLVQARVQGLISNEFELALADRQLSASLARVAPLEAQLAAAKRRVAVLVGLYPDQLKNELDRPVSLPATPPQVAPGMPVDLVRRRPDIRRAERDIAAATARIGVATADLFPRLSITAGAGVEGQGLGRHPEQARYIYSAGPSLYWPFLDFGRLDAVIQAQDFRTREALLTYQRTVITAVQEVDDSLNNYTADEDSLTQLGRAVSASQRADVLARQRYENGATDLLNVLDAERQLFDLQDQYAVAQESVIRDFISLYKSLGGGWEGYEAPAPPPPPKPALFATFETDAQRIGAVGAPVHP